MLKLYQLSDIAFGEDESDYVKRMMAELGGEGHARMEVMEVAKLRYRQEEVKGIIDALKNSDFSTGHFKINMRDAVVMLLQKVYEL
jgi:hypothetical protein